MVSSRPPDARPWCLALAGPTASGKTAAALALAREVPLEIISVDSALVYRGMDIGTAKPTAQERARVPHHLIDICDPLHAYSAARFAHDADALVSEINLRGRMALLVGGTMLYFKALIDGLHAMPPADASVRAALEQEAATAGWPAMHDRLAQVDPATAARLAPNDSQRIQRALEVYRISGQALSELHGGPGSQPAPTRFANMEMLSLEPRERHWLHQRVGLRFDTMLAQGLLDEVRALRARGDLHADLPSMRCVGYRQAWEALDRDWPVNILRERGIIATRQLAKRQLTWLRSMPKRHVIASDDDDTQARVMQAGLHLSQDRS
jgi:tRNA dimethylallyltransferase